MLFSFRESDNYHDFNLWEKEAPLRFRSGREPQLGRQGVPFEAVGVVHRMQFDGVAVIDFPGVEDLVYVFSNPELDRFFLTLTSF